MLDLNPDGKKLILSIDGGGMRGTITIAMLAELETLTGKPAYDLFDMVAGTSTGAIIAAGFGLGLTAQEMLADIYRKELPKAFRQQPRGLLLYLRYLLGGLRHLYDLQPFVETLGPFARGKKISDFTRPIVFMTTRDIRTANTYYIVSKGRGASMFADWPVIGAVGASGAAPIYFPPVLGNLIDGGVGVYTNPCLAATIEALEYIGAPDFEPNKVIHFSLGTGLPPNTHPEGAGGRFWLYNWVNYVIFAGLDDSGLQQVMSTRTIYGDRIDFRRYNPWLDRNSVANVLGVSLAGKPDPAILALDSFEPAQVDLMEEIGRAYARALHTAGAWSAPGYLPWNPVDPGKGKGHDGGHPLPDIASVNWAGSPYV